MELHVFPSPFLSPALLMHPKYINTPAPTIECYLCIYNFRTNNLLLHPSSKKYLLAEMQGEQCRKPQHIKIQRASDSVVANPSTFAHLHLRIIAEVGGERASDP